MPRFYYHFYFADPRSVSIIVLIPRYQQSILDTQRTAYSEFLVCSRCLWAHTCAVISTVIVLSPGRVGFWSIWHRLSHSISSWRSGPGLTGSVERVLSWFITQSNLLVINWPSLPAQTHPHTGQTADSTAHTHPTHSILPLNKFPEDMPAKTHCCASRLQRILYTGGVFSQVAMEAIIDCSEAKLYK